MAQQHFVLPRLVRWAGCYRRLIANCSVHTVKLREWINRLVRPELLLGSAKSGALLFMRLSSL